MLRILSAILLSLGLCTPALAADAPAPTARLVFTEIVTLLPTQVIGQSPLGLRQRVPITGGTFSGPGDGTPIAGTVLGGGSDWQLRRADGSLVIEADYMIETDDHVQIHVRNIGIVTHGADGKGNYAMAAPVFEAPMGRYGWLNDALFVSTLGPAGDGAHPAVRVTIYRIDPHH